MASELTPYSRPTATPYSTPAVGSRWRRRARRSAEPYSHSPAASDGTHDQQQGAGRRGAADGPCVLALERGDDHQQRDEDRHDARAARGRWSARPARTEESSSSSTRPETKMPCAAAIGRVR